MPHITINGRPLCQHTACQAGLDDARTVKHDDAGICGHLWLPSADKVAQAWKNAHPRLDVRVEDTPCPHTLDGLQPEKTQ